MYYTREYSRWSFLWTSHCAGPMERRFKPSPSLWLFFKLFYFRSLELVLAAITVARGRSQSVLCVGHSCGPVCLASLMSTGAWLKIILTFSHFNVAEEPSFARGLCPPVCSSLAHSNMYLKQVGMIPMCDFQCLSLLRTSCIVPHQVTGAKTTWKNVFPQFSLFHGVWALKFRLVFWNRRQAQACRVSQAWQRCKETPALPASHRG